MGVQCSYNLKTSILKFDNLHSYSGTYIGSKDEYEKESARSVKFPFICHIGVPGLGGTPISNGYGCKAHTSKGWGIR